MRKLLFLLGVVASSTLFSCQSNVNSLHPFYTDETLMKDYRVEGDWIAMCDSLSVIRISKFVYVRDSSTRICAYTLESLPVKRLYYSNAHPPKHRFLYVNGKYYCWVKGKCKGEAFEKSSEENPTLFHLFKLENGMRYVDMTYFGGEMNRMEYAVPVHNLAKLTVLKNAMLMNFFAEKAMSESFKKKMVKIPMQEFPVVSSQGKYAKQFLLTATPEKLQQFIVKYDREIFPQDSSTYLLQRIVWGNRNLNQRGYGKE